MNICFKKHLEENLFNLTQCQVDEFVLNNSPTHTDNFIFVWHIFARVCCEQNIGKDINTEWGMEERKTGDGECFGEMPQGRLRERLRERLLEYLGTISFTVN